MFRDLTRKNKALPTDECIRILETETRGVLSVLGDNGYPYGMPMNHYYDPDDGCIYFHTGKHGHRTDALKKCNKVSFCVFDQGVRAPGDWAYEVKSVIVFGKIEWIEDPETVADITRRLSYKFTKDETYIQTEIDRYLKATLLLKLTPEHICGKRVLEN